MSLKQIVIPLLITLIHFSFVSRTTAQEKKLSGLETQSTFQWTGRLRTYYEMTTIKESVSAEEIEIAKIEADSRLGVMGTFTEGVWTALFKLELDSHPNAGDSPGISRDAYIQVGNRSFDFRLGRYRIDGLFPGRYESFPDTNNNLSELHGLNQGIKVNLKKLPVDLDINYVAYTVDNNEVTGLKVGISSSIVTEVVISGSYSTKVQKGNPGLSTSDSISVDNEDVVTGTNGTKGDDRNSQNDTMLALLTEAKISSTGTVYGGYHIQNTSQSFADDTIDIDDTVITRLLIGVNYGLAAGAGAHIDYSSTSLAMGDDDPKVTTVMNISYIKPIVGKVYFRGGYTTLSTDTAGTQGLNERIIAIGLQIDF